MEVLIFGIILLIVGISIIFAFKNDYSYFGYFRYLAFLASGCCILSGLIFTINYVVLNKH